LKRTLIGTSAIRISLRAAVCALLAIPVACSDDDAPPADNTEAGTGGDDGTGGKGSGGKGGSANGGSAGKANGGSGGLTGGSSGAGGAGGKAGSAGTGGKAAGGTDGGTDVPDAEPPVPDGSAGSAGDAGDAAPPVNPCPDPEELTDANADNAKVCLKLVPETITFISADPRLDGNGTLIVQFFDSAKPAPGAPALAAIQYPPPSNPPAVPPATVPIAQLPPIIPFEGLPETVYMRVLFVDNATWFQAPTSLTWGMFIGGFDLTQGVFPPPPPLRPITLTKGKGTLLSTNLRALRRVTIGSLELAAGTTPKDDGQGPISIGAFNVAAPSGAPVLGGARLPCTNLQAAPVTNATSFLFTSFGQGGDFWIGAQLDDFNQLGNAQPGTIASLHADGTQTILDSQKVTVAADAYAVTVPKVELNFVIPGATLGTAPWIHYACP